MNITFVTSNQNKADVLAKHLQLPIKRADMELDEIQSMDINRIVEHKARQAYGELKAPVLVEDIAVYINALGGLPGPFVKWFIESMSLEELCNLVAKYDDPSATVKVVYGYCEGEKVKLFEGTVEGTIAPRPRGETGFGWNPIFIPDGFSKTYAEFTEAENERYSLRAAKVYPQLREFLQSLDSN